MPSQAPSDFKRKVTFAGSDKDACSSMGLHQIDEDSDVEKIADEIFLKADREPTLPIKNLNF